jgi:hypothetical protein
VATTQAVLEQIMAAKADGTASGRRQSPRSLRELVCWLPASIRCPIAVLASAEKYMTTKSFAAPDLGGVSLLLTIGYNPSHPP